MTGGAEICKVSGSELIGGSLVIVVNATDFDQWARLPIRLTFGARSSTREKMPDFKDQLDATTAEGSLLVLFIPSANRDGESLGKKEQRRWVRRALKMLGERFGGGTAFPRGWGTWRDDARGGKLVWDRPILIQCFSNEDSIREHAGALRDFLMELGTQTSQGAVACVLDRTMYLIHFPLAGDANGHRPQ